MDGSAWPPQSYGNQCFSGAERVCSCVLATAQAPYSDALYVGIELGLGRLDDFSYWHGTADFRAAATPSAMGFDRAGEATGMPARDPYRTCDMRRSSELYLADRIHVENALMVFSRG